MEEEDYKEYEKFLKLEFPHPNSLEWAFQWVRVRG